MAKRDDAADALELNAAIADAVKSEAGAAVIADPGPGRRGDAPPVTVEDGAEEVTPAAPAAGGDEPSKGEPTGGAADAEADQDNDLAEQRERYETVTGVSLEGVPDDLARPILEQFDGQESYIHKLQARLSAEPEKPAAPEPTADVPSSEDITDEDLLKAAGYDPEDFEVQQMSKFLLPGLRRELALEDQMQTILGRDQVRETETRWNGELDRLETSYGKLPFDRVQALRYAVEEQIADPEVLYFRLTRDVKKEAESTVRDARREAMKRIESGGLKPRNVDAGLDPVRPEMTLHEQVAAAAKSAAKETGRSWKDIFKDRDA